MYRILVENHINRREIIDFLIRIFQANNKNARQVFNLIFKYEPSFLAENFIIARDLKGFLIGLVRIVNRRLLVRDVFLNIGGISSVSVLPEWRGRGICSLLMKTAHDLMKIRGKDIAVLYGRRVMDGFYTRYGYYGIGQYIDFEINFLKAYKNRLTYVFFKGTQKYSRYVMKFYKNTYFSLSGSIDRTPEVWRYLFAQLKENNGIFKMVLFFDNKKPIGYCLIRREKIIELSLPLKYYQDLLGFLNFLKISILSIHPQHLFLKYCCSRVNTTSLKRRITLDGGYMARFINTENFLSKFGVSLSRKARILGLDNESINLLGKKIYFRDGNIKSTSNKTDINFKTKESAIRVLLGVNALRTDYDMTYNPDKLWIPYLFQDEDFHTCAWDEI